jgi:hypothetical protein
MGKNGCKAVPSAIECVVPNRVPTRPRELFNRARPRVLDFAAR